MTSFTTINQLHQTSYSEAVNQYCSRSDLLEEVRRKIISAVVKGESFPGQAQKMMGPEFLGCKEIQSLPRSASILDVGSGTGDNLRIMRDLGFEDLTGIDISPKMVEASKALTGLTVICGDVNDLHQKYDLVFAQAFIHLFPKENVVQILEKLIQLSRKRVYISTTLHEVSKEGIELKEGLEDKKVQRYRSRYTLSEVLGVVREVLSKKLNVQFRYFLLTDPLGKLWINGVFELIDVKKQYDTDGIMIYRQLYPEVEMEALDDELNQLRTTKPAPHTIMRYMAEGAFDRIEHFLTYCSPSLRAYLTSERVIKVVEVLLGEKAILLKEKLNYKMPGCGQFPPHQDAAAGWNRYASTHLTFALGYDASTEENGSLRFCLEKYKRELLSPIGMPLSQDVASSWKWINVTTRPGDALFFDSYLPHYSEPNLSPCSRRMSFLTFIPEAAGDFREAFFREKRERQPTIDDDCDLNNYERDAFGKLKTRD